MCYTLFVSFRMHLQRTYRKCFTNCVKNYLNGVTIRRRAAAHPSPPWLHPWRDENFVLAHCSSPTHDTMYDDCRTKVFLQHTRTCVWVGYDIFFALFFFLTEPIVCTLFRVTVATKSINNKK